MSICFVKMFKILWFFWILVFCVWCTVSAPIDNNYEIEWIGDYETDVEDGQYFEGDMILTDDQEAAIFGDRNAMLDRKYRWPNATIPYNLSDHHSDEQNKIIVKAMKQIEKVSCIRFRERTNESDYVQFEVCIYDLFQIVFPQLIFK